SRRSIRSPAWTAQRPTSPRRTLRTSSIRLSGAPEKVAAPHRDRFLHVAYHLFESTVQGRARRLRMAAPSALEATRDPPGHLAGRSPLVGADAEQHALLALPGHDREGVMRDEVVEVLARVGTQISRGLAAGRLQRLGHLLAADHHRRIAKLAPIL